MQELKKILEETIISIDQITELFYQQKLEQGYTRFEDTVTILTQLMNELFTINLDNSEFNIERDRIVQILTSTMHALEQKDTILLSDILQYELKELFIRIIDLL